MEFYELNYLFILLLLFFSVSLLLSHIQGYHYHLSKFHICVLVSLTKEARIYNGLKTISLTSGAGKTGQPLVKE